MGARGTTPRRGSPMPEFDAFKPFASETLLKQVVDELAKSEYKLYGPRPVVFHRGRPNKHAFDLNLGVVHFTEQDFRGLSEIFVRINGERGTRMTFCVYPSKQTPRDLILNVRGSPKAPAEID